MWILNFLPNFVFHLILTVGVIGLLAGFVLGFIPVINKYKLPIQVISIILTVLGVWYEGGIAKDQEYKLRIAELEKQVAIAEEKSKHANTIIQTKVVEKIKVVKQNVYLTQEVIKEVAGPQLDAICTLPKSAVSLHDSASRNEVPGGSASTDGSPSDVKASSLLSTVVENYGTYYEIREKLIGWQTWYNEQKKIFEAVK